MDASYRARHPYSDRAGQRRSRENRCLRRCGICCKGTISSDERLHYAFGETILQSMPGSYRQSHRPLKQRAIKNLDRIIASNLALFFSEFLQNLFGVPKYAYPGTHETNGGQVKFSILAVQFLQSHTNYYSEPSDSRLSSTSPKSSKFCASSSLILRLEFLISLMIFWSCAAFSSLLACGLSGSSL